MRVVLLSLMVAVSAMPVAAWERTTQTKVAADGIPLVQLVAEPGDMLGEPWLEYLRFIDYDLSGHWWRKSSQTLLDYNPGGAFAPNTYYGIYPDTRWWFPDMQALQATPAVTDALQATVDTNPVMRESDFLLLGTALNDDITNIQNYQQQSQEKLEARIAALEGRVKVTEDRVTATEDRIETAEGNISDLTAVLEIQAGQVSGQSDRLDDQAARLEQLETVDSSIIASVAAQAEQIVDLQQSRNDFSTDGLVTTEELNTRLSELDSPESVNNSPPYWPWLLAAAALISALIAWLASKTTKASIKSTKAMIEDPETGLAAAHAKADQTLAKTNQNTTAIEVLASRFKHKVNKIEAGKYQTLLPADIKKLEVGDEFIYHILVDSMHVALPATVERKTDKGETIVTVKPFSAKPPLVVGTKNFHRSLADMIEEQGIPDAIKASEPNAIAAE